MSWRPVNLMSVEVDREDVSQEAWLRLLEQGIRQPTPEQLREAQQTALANEAVCVAESRNAVRAMLAEVRACRGRKCRSEF